MITRFFQTEKKTFSSRPRILGSAVISVGPQVHGLLRSHNDASSSSTSDYNVGVCVCVCCYVRLVQRGYSIQKLHDAKFYMVVAPPFRAFPWGFLRGRILIEISEPIIPQQVCAGPMDSSHLPFRSKH